MTTDTSPPVKNLGLQEHGFVSFQDARPKNGEVVETVCVIDDENNCPDTASEREGGLNRETFNANATILDTHWRYPTECNFDTLPPVDIDGLLESGFTPGPWDADTVDPSDCTVWKDEKFLGNVGVSYQPVSVAFDFDAPNTRLIAAAPTLIHLVKAKTDECAAKDDRIAELEARVKELGDAVIDAIDDCGWKEEDRYHIDHWCENGIVKHDKNRVPSWSGDCPKCGDLRKLIPREALTKGQTHE